MKIKFLYLAILTLILSGCIANEDIDPSFYIVTTNGIKTSVEDNANTDSYSLSFITNSSQIVSGYVSGPGIPDTAMTKYTYANGIWTSETGNQKVFQQWMNRDGYRDIWEAFIDTGNEIPVLNREYSMNLSLQGEGKETKTVFIRGYCEYAPEITEPADGQTDVISVPGIKWLPPRYVTMLTNASGTYPLTVDVYARGYLVNIYRPDNTIIWTFRQYDAEITETVFNSDNTASGILEPGQTYRLELRFIDFGFNTSSQDIYFTVQ